jgi:hypothetical protein
MATEAEQLVLIKPLLAQTMVVFMRNDCATAESVERCRRTGESRVRNFRESAKGRNAAQARVSEQRCQIAGRGRRDRTLSSISVQDLTFMLVPLVHMAVILLVGAASF